ncbi:hypothetical protein DFJ58DRAFT_854529 [Suillus subalutaceus]|uniref:uncharacterized protein n=1 Tax=Suillus subalutaceus TaxID=48586 RepID=UPI001B86AEE2|nr:uncharacterized protein DFJ58DRAFT_854529 [Suillus subalutaceus]KAG1843312.1 hypothetical protein DFJ58DRAFT_854529 [Suillus subalutaceus]
MDDDESVDLLQQIFELKILDWDTEGSIIPETNVNQAVKSAYEDALKPTGNIGAPSAGIERCHILDQGKDEIAKQKPKRGRPRKRVVQRRVKLVPILPPDGPAQNIKHTNARVIRATISPVPESVSQDVDVLRDSLTDLHLASTIDEEDEQWKMADDEESHTADVLQQIMLSGILDWSPLEDDNSNSDDDVRAQSKKRDVRGIPKQTDNSKVHKQRRPRGRPARKATTHRQRQEVMVSTDKISSSKELRNRNSRCIIRATSKPVQDDKHEYVGHCERDNDNDLCIEEDEPRNGRSSNRRLRGRPKRRVVRARETASKRAVVHESHLSEFQSNTHRSPTHSRSRIPDDEYRLSPPPEAIGQSPSREASPPTIPELTVEEIASRAMARPGVWTSVLDTWASLGLNEWLEATVADFYLSHVWYELLGRSRMRYMNMHTAMAAEMEDEEVELFRRSSFIPPDGICPIVPVGFVVHHSDHFFTVIFDYQRQKAHVLGRHISNDAMDIDGLDPDDWNEWRGPDYWRRIGALHGWGTGDVADVSVISMDWEQNGVDCGPIACSVLEQCLSAGLDEHGNLPVFQVQCGHKLRIQILGLIAGRVRLCCSDYLMLLDVAREEWREDELPGEDIINAIQNGRHQAECLKLLRKLTVVSATCSICQRPVVNQEMDHPSHNGKNGVRTPVDQEDGCDAERSDEEDSMGTTLPTGRKKNLAKLFKAIKQLTGSRNRNDIVPRAVGTHIQVEPDTQPDVQDTTDSQRSVSASASRRRVKDWHLGSNKRFPRPIAPRSLAAYAGRRWIPDDRTFDDYEGGPTIEMLVTPREINQAMTFQAGGIQISTAWVHWVDHGYRITPSSFHIFYQCDPIATMDHVMPIGTTDSHDPSSQVPDRVTGAYSLARLGSDGGARQTHVADVEILAASELIDSAQHDPPLHHQCRFGHNAFVRGCTSHRYGDGTSLYVDLERDSVRFSEDEIEISLDIDSIIWTTKEFRCMGSVGIYLTPSFQTKPGIFKHNHTYVDITIPQSEADASAPGGRTEWLSKRFPMSAIPHTGIGRISSASSTLNLYIAFPRMIHQHPVNGRRITLMPKETLDIFWDRVLLPSIGDCTDVSWAPYLKHTLEEARYKARGGDGRKAGWGAPKTIPLSNDDFMDVQERMEARIRDGEGELSMYGSSFFILEGKGIKLLTKDGQRGRFEGPEEALRRNLSDLDWPYMMNRRHGELLVDVGISFTPHSPDVPVVGVWRLDALEASFGAGGYKRGEIHHHNTLSRYGAMQAEMQQERSQQTHIAFRSTYNLYYESIRTNNNQANFASDSDAYKLSPSYMAECFEIAKVVDGCKDKTYGVRDEYRVSGHAARIMLDNMESKAREYLQSDPILWVPSKIWFELIRRRVREIQRTQISIVKKNPPNLGILTGLLNHMLRSTTSTPIVYDFHVRESLALLEYRNVLETAGMFFLQEFDLDSDTCLEEVQQIDDVNVLALMGVNAKAQRDRAVGRMHAWRSSESELEDYPIGRTPTWTRLKAALANSPAMIMRPWMWSSRLSNTQLSVGRLIVMFTRQMWLMLTPEVFKGIQPHPNSLQEAMKCWTITSIDDTLSAVAFEACNAGLHDSTGVTPGRMGPKSRTFADRCSLFFPDPDASHKNNTQWSTLWEGDGYIAEFHKIMKAMAEDQQKLLKKGLHEVFSDLHCLPASSQRVWIQRNDAILFTTNPAFYRIDCVGRGAESQRKAPRARRAMKLIKGRRIFAADLMDSQPFDTDGNVRRKTARQKRREIQKKMTMAKRNKRVPPPPRPRKSRPFPMDIGESVERDDEMDVD